MSHLPTLSRRTALGALGLSAASVALLGANIPNAMAAAAPGTDRGKLAKKRLMLYTLYGGNDGMNTVVPYRDPLYRGLRPGLALPTKSLLPVSDDLAFNSELVALMKMFQAGEVAIIQDVGYPNPSLSHFETIDVWDTARLTRERAISQPSGWYGNLVMHNRAAFDACRFDAAAISFDPNDGFGQGTGVPILVADGATFDASTVMQRTALTDKMSPTARALAEMLNEGAETRDRFEARLRGAAPPRWDAKEAALDVQIRLSQWLLAHNAQTPLLAFAQGGFDMHTGLLDRHVPLLQAFDSSMAQIRARLISIGLWNDTVILVHSEFGRRVAENYAGGTDHGTAGPVFLIGGKVKGGIYGTRANLGALDEDGNLKFTTDFRRVYSTIATNLWGLETDPLAATGSRPLDIALT